MKISKIKNLGIIAIAIAVLYIFVGSSDKGQNVTPTFSKQIEWPKVTKIILSKEGKSFELLKDENKNSDVWNIPGRSGYQASNASIQAFLLKLVDISNAQKVQISDSGLDRLGLTETSKEKGQGVISLFNGEKEIGKVYLGSLRTVKGESLENQLSLSGQYVKSSLDPQVYMIPLAVALKLDAKDWIESKILNVSSDDIYQVVVKHGDDNSSSDKVIIDRSDNIFSSEQATFKADVKIPGNKMLNEGAITQLTSSLENFSVEDVFSESSEEFKPASKIGYVLYRLTSGLEHKLDLFKKDSKHFVKLYTSFNKDIAGELSKKEEAYVASKKEAVQKNTSESKDMSQDIIKDGKKLVLSSQGTADEMQGKYNGWVYEIPEVAFVKLNKKSSDFVRDQAKEKN